MLVITDGLPRGLGVVALDNRASGGRLFEADTYTCTHCNRVVVLNPERKRDRYKCRGCSHHICDECAAERMAGGECLTFTQRADRILEKLTRAQATRQAEAPSHPAAT